MAGFSRPIRTQSRPSTWTRTSTSKRNTSREPILGCRVGRPHRGAVWTPGFVSSSARAGGMISTGVGSETDSLELEIAVRAWTRADYLKHVPQHESGFVDVGPSEWTLVFDTQTTADLSLRFRVGSYET